MPTNNLPNRDEKLENAYETPDHLMYLYKKRGTERVFRYLTQMARQSGLAEVRHCEYAFKMNRKVSRVRKLLTQELHGYQIREEQFILLVLLFSMDPIRISVSDLAYQANRQCKNVREKLAGFERNGLISRETFGTGLQERIALTERGKNFIVSVIYHYLKTLDRLCAENETEQKKTASLKQ